MEKKRSKLTIKFIIGFVILGIAVSTGACYAGYQEFKSSIEKQYNDTAYQVANVAKSYVDLETAKQYGEIARKISKGLYSEEEQAQVVEEVLNSEEYKQLCAQFVELRKDMGANDIYLVYCDSDILDEYQGTKEGWNPFTYIVDSYTIEEYNYYLGDKSPINPEFIEEVKTIVKTSQRSSNYFVSQSDYGYNTTAFITVSMGSENLALGVEIPMLTIETSIQKYITTTIFITLATVVVGIVIFAIYLMRRVIRPINTVASETGKFLENSNQISEILGTINTNDEIEDLSLSVLKMENDLNTYIDNLTKVTAEKERIGAELDVARDIQSSMLPCIFPAFPERNEFDIHASMLAAKEVGGDFYDFFMVDDTHLAVVMADVSGKGVPAALFMVIGKTLLKDHTSPNRDLGEVFTEVNNLLCEANSEGLFITAFEAVIDLVTGEIRYVNAGHEMPIISRQGQSYEPIKVKAGFVLAGLENFKYKENVDYIKPGDSIFLYTDGVPEATNSSGELFGMDRTVEAVNRHKDLKACDMLPKIKEDIDAFVGEAPQFDDITMLRLDFNKFMKK